MPNQVGSLLDEQMTADYLGVSPRSLQKWRYEGKGPKYVRISHRCLRYRRVDLDQWLESLLRSNTSEEAALRKAR